MYPMHQMFIQDQEFTSQTIPCYFTVKFAFVRNVANKWILHSVFNYSYLECVDLILESVDILNGDLLTCDLAFNLLEPFVQLVQVLVGLPELLLHRLLHGENN